MATRHRLEFPGPIIDGQIRAALLTVTDHAKECSLVWSPGSLRTSGLSFQFFKAELRSLEMSEHLVNWLHEKRAYQAENFCVWGGASYGGVKHLPLGLSGSLVELVSGFYRRAMAKLVEAHGFEAGEEIPVRVLPIGEGFERQLLGCPVCGGRYVRLADATIVLAAKGDFCARPGVRGNVICLPGTCLEDHHFTLCFGQHDGVTVTWAEIRRVAADKVAPAFTLPPPTVKRS